MVTTQHKTGVVRITTGETGYPAHKAWAGACICGWRGQERQEFDDAQDDAWDHRIEHNNDFGDAASGFREDKQYPSTPFEP